MPMSYFRLRGDSGTDCKERIAALPVYHIDESTTDNLLETTRDYEAFILLLIAVLSR